MVLPKNIESLTVKQFQELTKVYNSDKDVLDKGVEYVSILTGKTFDEVEAMDYKLIGEAFKHISKLMGTKPKETLRRYIVVNGKVYKACLRADKFKAGQYIDLKNLSANDGWLDNMHLLLGCLYLPVNMFGFAKNYDGAKLKEISKDFEKAKIGDVYGLLFFYSSVLEKSSPIIQMYSEQATETLKNHLTEMMSDTEFLQSVGGGDTSSIN